MHLPGRGQCAEVGSSVARAARRRALRMRTQPDRHAAARRRAIAAAARRPSTTWALGCEASTGGRAVVAGGAYKKTKIQPSPLSLERRAVMGPACGPMAVLKGPFPSYWYRCSPLKQAPTLSGASGKLESASRLGAPSKLVQAVAPATTAWRCTGTLCKSTRKPSARAKREKPPRAAAACSRHLLATPKRKREPPRCPGDALQRATPNSVHRLPSGDSGARQHPRAPVGAPGPHPIATQARAREP